MSRSRRTRGKHWKAISIHSLIDRWQFVDILILCAYHIQSMRRKLFSIQQIKDESVALPFATVFILFLCSQKLWLRLHDKPIDSSENVCENSIQMRLIIKSCTLFEEVRCYLFGLAPLCAPLKNDVQMELVYSFRLRGILSGFFRFRCWCYCYCLFFTKLKFYVSEYMMHTCMQISLCTRGVCACECEWLFSLHVERCSPCASIGWFADSQSAWH